MLLQILRRDIILIHAQDPITRARLTIQTTLDLPAYKQIPAPFNSASPADCTEPNFAGERTSGRAYIHICIQRHVFACLRFGRKGFYRYEFNFRTNNPLSFSLHFPLSPSSFSLPVSATLDEPSVMCQCRRGLQGT